MKQKNEHVHDDDQEEEEEDNVNFQKMYQQMDEVTDEDKKEDDKKEEEDVADEKKMETMFEKIKGQSYINILFFAIINIVLLTMTVYIGQWIFFEGTILWIEIIFFIVLGAVFWLYQSMLAIKRLDTETNTNTFVTLITIIPYLVCFIGLSVLNMNFPHWKMGFALWIRFVEDLLGNSDKDRMARIFKQRPIMSANDLADAAVRVVDASHPAPVSIELGALDLNKIGYVPCAMFDDWIEKEKMTGNVYTQHEIYQVLGEEYLIKDELNELRRNICLVDLVAWMSGVGTTAVVLFLAIFFCLNQPFVKRLYDQHSSGRDRGRVRSIIGSKDLVQDFKKKIEQSAEESRLYSAIAIT